MRDSVPRSALVIAHPGHELRVFRWLETVHPRVFVLTDGSGATGYSRLATTTRLLADAGACPGSIYGRLTDREAYAAMLKQETALFVAMAEELAGAFTRERIELVAGDAVEGYNPIHDVCRLLVNAAVELASRRAGRAIENVDFLLTGRPDDGLESMPPTVRVVRLDEAAFRRKLAVARGYTELTGDVGTALETIGPDAFRIEVLRPVAVTSNGDGLPDGAPYYEHHGEKRVAGGKYTQAIRRREHVTPIAEALRDYVTRTRP